MQRRSASVSGIGMALQEERDTIGVDSSAEAGEAKPFLVDNSQGRPLSDVPMSAMLNLGVDAMKAEEFKDCKSSKTSPSKDSIFKDFCRGQPPRRSFLNTASGLPPRLRMSRRSTLADKPELDTLLEASMVRFRDQEFLAVNENTVRCLYYYLNGSKPLVHHWRFNGLLINNKTKEVRVGLLVKILETIGVYCEHLAIVAPFHPGELGNAFDYEVGNFDPGNDWEKILAALPKLGRLTFEHPDGEPPNLSREPLHALGRALDTSKNLQEGLDFKMYAPEKVYFNYHKDHHSSPGSKPLCLVGDNMVYVDGPEDFGLSDNRPVFGKAEDIK